jgi:hypothetical protein
MKAPISLSVVLVLFIAANSFAQQGRPLSPSAGPPPEPVQPVDSTYLPPIESKVSTLELVSAVREDYFIHIKLKNTSNKAIYSLRYSYHKSGQSVMLSFVGSEEKYYYAAGETFTYEYGYVPNSIFAREPITFEAVLYEDGTGDGNADKVKSLQDIFLRNRKELEHIIASLSAAIQSPQIEVATNLTNVLDQLSETPDYMFGVDLQGIAGGTLPSWKATAMHLVHDVFDAKSQGSIDSIRESLEKIKARFEKTLSHYPGVP